MSKITFISVIFCVLFSVTFSALPTPDPQMVKDFESLLHKFNLSYYGEEYQQRLRAFEKKYKEDKEIHSVGDAFDWGVEKLTGMTPNEIKESEKNSASDRHNFKLGNGGAKNLDKKITKYLGGVVINSAGIYTSTHRPSSASITEISYSAILLPLILCSIIINTL
uniref:Uncharacterized protein n=1 Tax=Panagrolaimus davidi TaxID=227884 RepID=A0A914Q765_9BILA